jgi:hypothetical protein
MFNVRLHNSYCKLNTSIIKVTKDKDLEACYSITWSRFTYSSEQRSTAGSCECGINPFDTTVEYTRQACTRLLCD